MKKILAGILAAALVLAIGIVAFAQAPHSTIDGFGSQFVTGDAEVEVRAMMYDVRANDLVIHVKVTNTSAGALTFDNNEMRLYHDDGGDMALAATDTSWNFDPIAAGEDDELTINFTIAALEVTFALAADVSVS